MALISSAFYTWAADYEEIINASIISVPLYHGTFNWDS